MNLRRTAGNAYFLLHPGPLDLLLYTFSGYAVLMVIAQVRFLPLYRTLSFTPAFWAFTFPPANMALFTVRWLELEHPAGSSAYAWVLVAAVTPLQRCGARSGGRLTPTPLAGIDGLESAGGEEGRWR